MGLSQALRPSWIQLHLNLEASQQEQLILQLQSLNEVLGCERMTMGLKTNLQAWTKAQGTVQRGEKL